MNSIKSSVREEISKTSATAKEKTVAKPFKLKRFYTPKDVIAHNNSTDCWVSFFHEVFDLTKLIQENFNCTLLILSNY